jgi:ABC-type sugar transport system ATPase subunit
MDHRRKSFDQALETYGGDHAMTTEKATAIEFCGLTKRYGNVLALDQIDLTVGIGQFVALLGPSGCGKTTLLRCLAGFETPDEGSIRIDGRTVFDARAGVFVPPGERDLGMVFQSYALWPHMRVADNVGFGLELKKLGRTEREAIVEKVLTDVGLGGLGHRYPSELSGGQQQRVALARLIATKPPLFLMDEPLSNLDARLRMDMRAELKRLHRSSGVATVYVTHDQTEAMTMADLIVVMKDGKILQASAPRELYRYPANLDVAEFVGMPRMNLARARTSADEHGEFLEFMGIRVDLPYAIGKREVTIAMRPEDVTLSRNPVARGVAFSVAQVFPSGAETLIQVERDHESLYARADHRCDLAPGDTVYVRVVLDEINVYDVERNSLISTSAPSTVQAV